jgi:uncharacterized protein
MLEIGIVSFVAFAAALLTFFSGFGLGTLLTPVMAFFFPIDVAIGLTAIVHFLNNLFKLAMVGRNADREVLIRFGIPAVLAALVGAWLLLRISDTPALYTYTLWGKTFQIQAVKLCIAVLLVGFTLLDFVPSLSKIAFGREKLTLGGFLSGFFGGLSGNQGALRSAFLVKAGLSKEAFVATGCVVSTMIDFSRLSVYASRLTRFDVQDYVPLLACASAAAFAGAYLGNKLLKKVTFHFVQVVVAVMLFCIAIALGAGWL